MTVIIRSLLLDALSQIGRMLPEVVETNRVPVRFSQNPVDGVQVPDLDSVGRANARVPLRFHFGGLRLIRERVN